MSPGLTSASIHAVVNCFLLCEARLRIVNDIGERVAAVVLVPFLRVFVCSCSDRGSGGDCSSGTGDSSSCRGSRKDTGAGATESAGGEGREGGRIGGGCAGYQCSCNNIRSYCTGCANSC